MTDAITIGDDSGGSEPAAAWHGPDPLLLDARLRAVFARGEFTLLAAAATGASTPGRTFTELTQLRELGLVESPFPGHYRCAALVGPCEILDPADAEAARERAERWYIAAARAAAVPLLGGILPPALTQGLPHRAEPMIVDAFAALEWSQHNRPTLLDLARRAARDGRCEAAFDLALAVIVAAMADNATGTWIEMAELGRDAARALGDRHAEAFAIEHLGKAMRQIGELDRAEQIQTEALEIRQKIEHKPGVVYSVNALGLVHWSKRQFAAARGQFEQALKLAEQIDEHVFAAYARQNLAGVLLDELAVPGTDPRHVETEIFQVLELLADATAGQLRAESAHPVANCLTLSAKAIRATGRSADAASAVQVAVRAVEACDTAAKPGIAGHDYAEAARCLAAAGHPAHADRWFTAALALFHAAGDTIRESALRQELTEARAAAAAADPPAPAAPTGKTEG